MDTFFKYSKTLYLLLLFIGMIACNKENIENDLSTTTNGITLQINVSGAEEIKNSRAESLRTDYNQIRDINIVLTDGTNIKKILYVPENTSSNVNIGEDESGLVEGSTPSVGHQIIYHVGRNDIIGVTDIYVVCNFTGDRNGNLNEYSIKTVDELKGLKQKASIGNLPTTAVLFGYAEKDVNNNTNYIAKLDRITAMITVSLKVSENGLKEGVSVTPMKIALHNVPTSCFIGKDNVATDENITIDGRSQSINWGEINSNTSADKEFGGHDNDDNITPLFMFENKQGDFNLSNESESQKTPDPEKKNLCSYLEIDAGYRYIPTVTDDNQHNIAGTIKYRLYLGRDILSNFDVERNKHYQVTLTLQGMAGLVEEGITDTDGAFIALGKDLSWRIETDLKDGGAFLSEDLPMSSNGYLAWLGFVADPKKEYIIYCKSNDHGSWIKAQTQYGLFSPTKDSPAEIYPANEVPNGKEGLSYIKLFGAGWPHNNWPSNLTSVELWTKKGYREEILVLAEKNGQIIDELEIHQWLPMPVFENGGNNPVKDATMFFSRIDVYQGEELPCIPETEFFKGKSIDELWKTKGHYYTQPGLSGSRSYNHNYGFDRCAAFYWTNRGNLPFEQVGGHPTSAITTAIYRAGNVTGDSGETTDFTSTGLGNIGLPTVEEWEKIRKFGVIDPRFGISNVPYWTSSLEGTENGKTYNYYTGTTQTEERLNKHRVRLIYHKNNYSFQ